MVQNETRGFSFRKNSKKDGRREKLGVGFQYIMYILSVQKKKMSGAQVLYMISFIRTKQKRVGPAIAAVEVSRSTRSHPIKNVRPLFYIKSTMLNDERKELLSHFSRVVARPIPPSAGLQVDWE